MSAPMRSRDLPLGLLGPSALWWSLRGGDGLAVVAGPFVTCPDCGTVRAFFILRQDLSPASGSTWRYACIGCDGEKARQ